MLKVTSSAFDNNAEMPKQYGCAGASQSPPLAIAGVPASAKSLALIVTDPDAPRGTFTHWVVWNIPPSTTSIAAGQEPAGSQGKNDFGANGYGAPCPPSGSHRYVFHVSAVDTMLNVPAGASRADVEKAMKGHVVAEGELVGKYRK